jgi:putative transposase
MVEEMLAARGILGSHETVCQRALKFGQEQLAGRKHWLWRAVDQHGIVLDILVQSRRNAKAAKRLLRKLLKKQGMAARVMITDNTVPQNER